MSRQTIKHCRTQIQIISRTSDTTIHNLHIHTSIRTHALVEPSYPDLLPTQRIIVAIRQTYQICVPDNMRDGAYCFLGSVLVTAGAVSGVPGVVVCEVAGEYAGVRGERQVLCLLRVGSEISDVRRGKTKKKCAQRLMREPRSGRLRFTVPDE
jgi:hypothetical protein